jgi:hypothetical protein
MTDENKFLGSPKLPTDPPTELDEKPYAQAAWIRIITANPNLTDLDLEMVLEFCGMVEELRQLESMRSKALEIQAKYETEQIRNLDETLKCTRLQQEEIQAILESGDLEKYTEKLSGFLNDPVENLLDHLYNSVMMIDDRIAGKKEFMRKLYSQLRPANHEIKPDRLEELIGAEDKELLADRLEHVLNYGAGYGDVTMVIAKREIQTITAKTSDKAHGKKRKK